MTKTLFKVCIAFATFAAAAQAQQFSSKYFDCWMENVAHVDASEIQRLGIKTYGDSWICGCFNVEDTDGEDWQEGEVLTKVNKVWDLPPYEIYPCRAKDCSDTSETYNKSLDLCVDHLNNSSFSLSDFKEGGKVHEAIAQKFPESKKKAKKDDDSNLTDFGKYLEERKDRSDSVLCFFQYHERPGTERFLDWDKKGVFSISGLPEKLLPESIGSFPDYSDVRCKDGNEWSGFLVNGYIENVMHVDAEGKFHGRETGYGNDLTLPARQGKDFGKVLYTVDYVHGVKNGTAKFYRYSAMDNIGVTDKKLLKKLEKYYFLHLEVPYRKGAVHGVVNMFSHKGFLMAEVPYWDNTIHGRVVVHYPFVEDVKAIEAADKKELKRISKIKKKKEKEEAMEAFQKMKEEREKNKPKDKVTIDYKKGKLNGPNDLGYSFGNYRDGKLDGKYMTFTVKETCYDWIPVNGLEGLDSTTTNKVCLTEKQDKKSWGTFRNGELQGLIECANGIKGKENVDCDHAY